MNWRSFHQAAPHRAYYRRPFPYQRFQQKGPGLLHRWAARPTFYYEVGGIAATGAGFYVYNLEEVPVSKRRRFNILPPEWEAAMGAATYEQILQEFGPQILPVHRPEHRLVKRVLDRLIPHSGLADDGNSTWEVHVINDPRQINAFVIPGNKVFVFTGILGICETEDGLAAVLGHEIAHNVAHHTAERVSQLALLLPIFAPIYIGLTGMLGYDFGITGFIMNSAFRLPGSRASEAEADYIGLLMMAASCYDPSQALRFWQRMELVEKAQGGGAPPEFLSTHPSNHNRIEKIRGWLEEAERKRDESACGKMGGYTRDFMRSVGYSRA
jgi:predicted Zn-dependent protease